MANTTSFILGIVLTLAVAIPVMITDNKQNGVECIEHVKVFYDGYADLECALFTWRGETFATEYAPITSYQETKEGV